jgi:hypothetical protein
VWDLPLASSFTGSRLVAARHDATVGAWLAFVAFLLLLPLSPVGAFWNYLRGSFYTSVGKLITSGEAWHLWDTVNYTKLNGADFFKSIGITVPMQPTEANKNQ